MNSKNRFIIFSVVIIVLIIVSFSSLIVTANMRVSENIIRESEVNKIPSSSEKFSDIIENRKVRILIDPGHNAATKGALGYLGYEYYMNLRVARELAKILSEDERFEYFLSRDGAYYSRPIKEYMTEFVEYNNDKIDMPAVEIAWDKMDSNILKNITYQMTIQGDCLEKEMIKGLVYKDLDKNNTHHK